MEIYWIELTQTDAGVLSRLPAKLIVPEGSNITEALTVLGIANQHELLRERRVAIFGKYALPDTLLYEGDRIEILDNLQFDPMESRRRRHAHKLQTESKTHPGKAAPRKSKKQS